MKIEEELPDDFCINHFIARVQREIEVKAGLGHLGTIGFERQGCYDSCNGYATNCKCYEPNLQK